MLSLPDVVRSGYYCSSKVLIAFQAASALVLTPVHRKYQYFRVTDFKPSGGNTAKEPSKLLTALCEGSKRLHITRPRPSLSMPQASVAFTSAFASQKKEICGKRLQAFSFFDKEMRYNKETLSCIPPVRLPFSYLPPSELTSVPGKKTQSLLSTNKQVFP